MQGERSCAWAAQLCQHIFLIHATRHYVNLKGEILRDAADHSQGISRRKPPDKKMLGPTLASSLEKLQDHKLLMTSWGCVYEKPIFFFNNLLDSKTFAVHKNGCVSTLYT